MLSKRLLIIDALNMYYRAYIVDPSLSANGQPIGGAKGFLKILQKLVRETKPDRIVICWDGEGGSRKRRAVNKNYKEGRKPLRLNRNVKVLSEQEELENKIWQQTRLIEYLNCMPVTQLMFPEVEADDVIAQVARMPHFAEWQKVIVSSDKDFIQLLDEETVLFRPIQKEVLNKNRIIEEYGIHPNNFALARAIVGDKSDNLEGVPGAGLATVKKRFPFLVEDKSYFVKDVVSASKKAEKKLKIFEKIIELEDVVKQNYKLMQLYSPNMSVQAKKKTKYIVENSQLTLNKTEITKMLIYDGFGEFNLSELYQNFQKMMLDKKNKQ
mgnify:CR=1 FL=1